MRALGLSFSGHGSSICLVEDGRVVAAVNLERLTRVKFALATVPGYKKSLAIAFKVAFDRPDIPPIANFYDVFPEMLHAVTGERDLAKAEIDLVVKTHDNIRPIANNPEPYQEFCEYFDATKTFFDLEHHRCHAYAAFLGSPFDSAAVLTIDGRGENLDRLGGGAISTTLGTGHDQQVEAFTEVLSPASVGGLYASVTHHLGFRDEQEGNTMALAAFGSDRFYSQVHDEALELYEDGSFALRPTAAADDLNFLARMREFVPPRSREEPFTQDHYDVAWACQKLSEDVILHVTSALQRRTGASRLAVAGGVALNCVANAEVLRSTSFDELYVMPNAGDRGLSLGAALYGYHHILGGRERHPVTHDHLGPAASDTDIQRALDAIPGTAWKRCDDIERECAALVARGRIIGWVQGGGEFGPRALGHRSIIADPRTAESKARLDREIKRREWFRPYAPSVLAQRADEYFEMLGPSPYMLIAVKTRPEVRDKVPAIVHVDGSARVQTVEAAIEPRYHRLISEFEALTGVPLVLNTSFNGYGEPMVETPVDAVTAMHAMSLDALGIGDYLAWPEGSPP